MGLDFEDEDRTVVLVAVQNPVPPLGKQRVHLWIHNPNPFYRRWWKRLMAELDMVARSQRDEEKRHYK